MFKSFLQSTFLDSLNTAYYINIIVIGIGLATNLISIVIFIRKKLNSNTNIGIMHSILCFLNMLPLLNSIILIQILPSMTGLNLITYTSFSCKLVSFWLRLALTLPSAQQVLITFMLFVSVRSPLQYIKMRKNTNKILLVTYISIFLINFQYFFYELEPISKSEPNSSSNSSAYECNGSDLLAISLDMVGLGVRFVVPLLIMTGMNLLIFYQVYQSKKMFCSVKKKGIKIFLTSIVIVNFMFLVFYIPWAVVMVLNYYFYFNLNTNNYLNFFYSTHNYFNYAKSISYLNNSITFFVHIVFNKLFKSEIVSIIKKFRQTVKIKPAPTSASNLIQAKS